MTDIQDLRHRTHWLMRRYNINNGDALYREMRDAVEVAVKKERIEKEALQKEVERLRLENHSLRLNSAEHAQALQKEVEELRRDAERYRWLRERVMIDRNVWQPANAPEQLDAAIDAAIASTTTPTDALLRPRE